MKIIIIAFALFAAVSCDVSHVVNTDGWFKDGSGYHYNKPEVKFEEPEETIQPIAVTEETVAVTEVSAQEVVTEAANEITPNNEYLPPSGELKEYLPPKIEEAKRKRQIQGRNANHIVRKL